MNKKALFMLVCFVLFVLLIIPGCAAEDAVVSEPDEDEDITEPEDLEVIEIKLAMVIGTAEPAYDALLVLKDRVEDRTGGRVEIQIYPDAQLGSDPDVYEQARAGVNVMAYASYLDDYSTDHGIIHGPYLGTVEEKLQLTKTDWFDGIKQQILDDAGIRIVAWNWLFGSRHVIANKPVPTPADMKGLKVRVPPTQMWIETFTAMGASPTELPWADVYTALSQKVVDGAECPLSTHYASKLFEVADYITLTGHFTQVNGWIVGEKFWETLPADIQQILLEEFEYAGDYNTEVVLQREQEFIEILENEGVTFVEADTEAFRQATEVVYEKLSEKWSPGLYDSLKEAMGR